VNLSACTGYWWLLSESYVVLTLKQPTFL
jgi:hypothetical protein